MIDNDLHALAIGLSAQQDANDLTRCVANLTLAVEHLVSSVRSIDSRLRTLEIPHAVKGGSPKEPEGETCKNLYDISGCARTRGSWCFNGDCTGHSSKIRG